MRVSFRSWGFHDFFRSVRWFFVIFELLFRPFSCTRHQKSCIPSDHQTCSPRICSKQRICRVFLERASCESSFSVQGRGVAFWGREAATIVAFLCKSMYSLLPLSFFAIHSSTHRQSKKFFRITFTKARGPQGRQYNGPMASILLPLSALPPQSLKRSRESIAYGANKQALKAMNAAGPHLRASKTCDPKHPLHRCKTGKPGR